MTEENKVTDENQASEIPDTEEGAALLKRNLAEETEKANKYLANWQRTEADFSNYKKRVEQEKNETTAFANRDAIRALLPVLDDMERALASLPPQSAKPIWVDGIKLIHRKLQTILESYGVTEVEAVGKPFDPNIHEAIAHVEGKEGMVIHEIQKGYKMKDKLLRPSLVAVGNGKVDEHERKTDEEKPQETSDT